MKLYLVPDFFYWDFFLKFEEDKHELEKALAEIWLIVLLLFEHVHCFVDFKDLPVPLSSIDRLIK